MSRSGYSEGCDDHWALIRWRGAVNAAIRGKRGQSFLREMLAALDALPEPRLIAEFLVLRPEEAGYTGTPGCCAMGAVALARGMDLDNVDAFDSDNVADAFGIARALAKEIAYENDEAAHWRGETPEQRFTRVRAWVAEQLS